MCFFSSEIRFSPHIGRINILYAYRPGPAVDATANAVIAPTPTTCRHRTIDINDFQVVHVHANKGALRGTAKQIGFNLGGKMYECKGRSIAKRSRKSIPNNTDNRASKPSE